MTVIAADGVSVVGDGRTTLGQSEIGLERTRKITIKYGRIYAVCGISGLLDVLADWHNAGADPAKMPAGVKGWSLLVIDDAGPTYFHEEQPYAVRLSYPATMGSGADYAMGAILAGASARRAVEIAIAKDSRCGGDIQVIDIAEALSLNQQLQAAE